MRRGIAILSAAIVAAATSAWAQTTPAPTPAPAPPAAPARPVFQTTKVEGTDNVYIFRYMNHQSMFVVTPAGVIATDPIGYVRREASKVYVDEIKKVTNQPIRYLIYSHHHYDHIAGGQAFKDAGATIIAHRRAKERLQQIDDPFTPLPDEVMENERTITLGGVTLELKYLGPNHSDSTLLMRLPAQKIVFAVDFIGVGAFPGRGMIDSYPIEWEASLKAVLAMDWDRLIPGHPGPGDRLGTKKDVQDLLTILQEASAAVKAAAREGKCWDAAENEIKLDKYKDMPGYATGLPMVLRRYCGLWGRGT
ncbi:MAG: MBL fold metallo-hydrolase [Alphaproteobacteria bacterium]|nr:MBL fold metallo-hydrolase [Alphaproteobacteria bacterium]